MNLCFDLDGPIIDVTDRYYRAYLESLVDTNITKEQVLSKEDFWRLKQNRVTEVEIGIISSQSIGDSKTSAELRKDLTFKHDYLSLDKMFEDVFETFDYLKSQNIIFFIVTLRRKKHLDQAVKQFKLNKHLTSERLFSLTDDEKMTNDIQAKHLLLTNAINKLHLDPRETYMIGDSETDIHAARLARYGKVIGISRGIRSKEQLKTLRPDYLISNLTELSTIIQKIPA